MKKHLWLAAIVLIFSILVGCAQNGGNSSTIETEAVAPTGKLEGCSLYVKAVEGLPEDFIFGMDASQVPSLEASGVKYYDANGEEKDVFRILAENGVNYIRVRVWNDPFDAEGHGYGGGNCTIDTALEIGKRATKYGMSLLVDFHYSDFWADPGKQMAPKAWKDLDLDTKAKELERYTRESLQKLKDAGVKVGMVQVGNETNGAMCGERDWPSVVKLMNAGSKAIREVYPEAKVAVHFANPENGNYSDYAAALRDNGLDYDVFGSSYYPYWHGSLANLTKVLKQIRLVFGKEVMVMESSYAWTTEDSDFSGNTIGAESAVDKPYPYCLQGQVNNLREVTQAVQDAGGIGVCYWEGTWISVGGASREQNQKLWEQYGSGWASSYAAEYDPDDAGKWYGGCAVDNQAFFDAKGHVLESLMAFNLIRYGNETEQRVLEVEELQSMIVLGDDFSLPQTVNAVMSDNSRQPIPVSWSVEPSELAEWLKSPGVHVINGEAEGMPVKLTLSIQGVNHLKNPSFEDGVDAPWVVDDIGGCKDLMIEKKAGDSRTGDWHYHFWSPDAGTVQFTLEQTAEELESGLYDYSIWIMGGDCGDAEVYAYVKLDGEIVASAPMEITIWNEWHCGEITGIEYSENQTLTVGISVKTDAAGAWGKIDDASLSKR
ncbi:MAG: glycosyl hydrolase 53 family protein [Oscillospiraceae bacterium]|nr:glycosyl hydrolase 53 family protein [Oscillospiraceae bacterium]MBR4656867.1 glycosyl hydrolase 53 family protein [Oscillospiraceae bacterium]